MCSLGNLAGGLVGNAAAGGLGGLARKGVFGLAGLIGGKKKKPNREETLYGSDG